MNNDSDHGPEQNQNKKTETLENGRYTCPMHPQIIENKPGKCPICGMDLVRIDMGEKDGEVHHNHD
ncbi:MAG: heavy metal-binding domain-containing protein, partial [Saprospiraceae bacterium]